MEQLVIGKYPADSFCLWDGDELIARTAIFIFDSPEDMLLQLKIALIAYMRGNHLPYLYVNTGIRLLLKHIYKYKPKNYSNNDLELIKIAYYYNSNIGKLNRMDYGILSFGIIPDYRQPLGRMNLSCIPGPHNMGSYYSNIFNEQHVRLNLISKQTAQNYCNII